MLYTEVAAILLKLDNKEGTVKSLVYNSRHKNKRQLYALLCETLKYGSIIDDIITSTQLLKREKFLKKHMAQVLVYEQLFGKGLQIGGKYREAMNRNKTALHSALVRLKVRSKVSRNEDLLPDTVKSQVSLPRYVRVNTLKISVEEAIEKLKKAGFSLADKPSVENFGNTIRDLETGQFVQDPHIPALLVFPPETGFHDNQLYKSGEIILQDKASCIPAQVLAPPPGACVIDACAAPGNKTSHMASLMQNNGKIFAFDIDAKRLATMRSLTQRAGVSCAQLVHGSFLECDPGDPRYSGVEYILLDPSCSGSGIANRLDHLTDEEGSISTERLESLAQFQLSALRHALSFPAARRVAYSTCSVHRQENEDVVQAALQEYEGKYHLQHILPTWRHRGTDTFPQAHRCIRASPEQDRTNGFFVALFEKNSERVDVKVEQTTSQNTEHGENAFVKKKRRRKRKKNVSVEKRTEQSKTTKTPETNGKEELEGKELVGKQLVGKQLVGKECVSQKVQTENTSRPKKRRKKMKQET
ncbi:28S rRNA (cytosine-C(5))-methyltransferase-like isoform X1 [Branchiostoma floridae]|uniref:28S rRNA (Cytosine-C(5))-methyltransferase-like isoform X1 n=1 Tax=Branchiostoma floridae TaxID=7739 RepID=A0A9J7LR61_BRAFL|nr:28S rRNA (cytosine-C(5))-methyltransferase-like isoform X1 [Branchiostoma floridae]